MHFIIHEYSACNLNAADGHTITHKVIIITSSIVIRYEHMLLDTSLHYYLHCEQQNFHSFYIMSIANHSNGISSFFLHPIGYLLRAIQSSCDDHGVHNL